MWVKARDPCGHRDQPGRMGNGNCVWELELVRGEEEMSPWCSHIEGKSGRKDEPSCGQRPLSPEL